MTDRRVFLDDYQLEERGHVGSFWSDGQRISHGSCSCGRWKCEEMTDAEDVLASWRSHVDDDELIKAEAEAWRRLRGFHLDVIEAGIRGRANYPEWAEAQAEWEGVFNEVKARGLTEVLIWGRGRSRQG